MCKDYYFLKFYLSVSSYLFPFTPYNPEHSEAQTDFRNVTLKPIPCLSPKRIIYPYFTPQRRGYCKCIFGRSCIRLKYGVFRI